MKSKDLAVYLGCPAQQVNDWKSGRRPIPKHHLEIMCELLNVPPELSYLFLKKVLTEVDKCEIEILLTRSKLKNLEENLDETDDVAITNAVKAQFKLEISFQERNIELLKTIHNLKQEMSKYVHTPEEFYDNLKKVDQLMLDLK